MSSVDTLRFSGFAKLYSVSRPQAPKVATELVLQYLRKPQSELTVDLGSGTGLSTAIWKNPSARVVGIEPTLEPVSTIEEVDRLLTKNGVFSVYDYLWPISWDWEAESAYGELLRKVTDVLKIRPGPKENIVYFPKSGHRKNIENSGKFRYVTEVMFDNVEDCDAERFVGMALSQGQVQKALQDRRSEVEGAIEEYRKICLRSKQKQMRVSYRMILAVK